MTEDQIAESILEAHDKWLESGGSHASPDVKRHRLRTNIADHLQSAFGRGVREALKKQSADQVQYQEAAQSTRPGRSDNISKVALGMSLGMAVGGSTGAADVPPQTPRYPQPERPSPVASDQTDSTSQE